MPSAAEARPPYSPTVSGVMGELSRSGSVSAAALVRAVLKRHPEYGNGRARSLEVKETSRRHTVEEWMAAVRGVLRDPSMEIHGRVLILALGRVDPELRQHLEEEGIADALRAEIREGPEGPLFLPLAVPPADGLTVARAIDGAFGPLKPEEARALRIAAAAAGPERPVNSTLLFAALLSGEPRRTAAVVLNELVRQHEAKSDAPFALLEALGLTSSYGLSSLPAEPGSRDDAEPLTAELVSALQTAHALAGGDGMTTREVMAGLLCRTDPANAPDVQRALEGFDLTALRRALLARASVHLAPAKKREWGKLLGFGDDPRRALSGYASDYVDLELKKDEAKKLLETDPMGIAHEVQALATVLAADKVEPPLSVGLFGDWGSGKSTFMRRLRAEMTLLQGQDGYCRRIAQIPFNAWHFMDANLWASLMTRILDGLAQEMASHEPKFSPEAAKKKLAEDLAKANGVYAEAEKQLKAAGREVGRARKELAAARLARAKKEKTFAGAFDDLAALLATDEQTKSDIDKAAEEIGIKSAAQSFQQLADQVAELQTISGRASAVVLGLLRSPLSLLAMAALILVLPAVVAGAVALLKGGEGLRLFLSGTAFLGGLVTWLSTQVRRVSSWTDKLQDAYGRARTAREARLKQQNAKDETQLAAAQERERAAEARVQEAQRRVMELEKQKAELEPAARMRKFVEERAASAEYRQQLGIVSLVRRDFERLSDLLAEARTEGTNHDAAAADAGGSRLPAMDRIVLYIDDLDRCRVERVVEVLEAIHLLMSFRLFVVVVAVDPRWLTRCLGQHYPDLLAGPGKAQPNGGAGEAATPQDYLEKIFNIPYSLRPIEPDGYQNLVNEYLGPAPAKGNGKASGTREGDAIRAHATHEAGGAQVPGKDAQAQSNSREGGSTDATPATGATATGTARTPAPSTPPPPTQIEFTSPERTDIARLAPLFVTPRSVKRFVNTYRLLRANLEAWEVAGFEGTEDQPGEYRLALLLLAAVTAHPVEATDLRRRLGEAASIRGLLSVLRKEPVGKDAEKESAGTDRAAAAEPSWARFLAALQATCDAGYGDVDLAAASTWAARAARFSFSVGPAA